jgi:hypothetical protein
MIIKPQEAKVSESAKPQEAKVSAAHKTSVSDSENLSFHPGKPQPAKETLSKDSSKDSSKPRAREEVAGEKKGNGRYKHPHAVLLDKLLSAAADNVEYDKQWGVVAFGIGQMEPIFDLISHDRCSLEADILPAIRDVVPTLTEPLKTWLDVRIRDACLARRGAREADAARAKEAP